jgi:hypothetical protein
MNFISMKVQIENLGNTHVMNLSQRLMDWNPGKYIWNEIPSVSLWIEMLVIHMCWIWFMWGYGLKSLGIHKCSCKFMDWNAGNTYVINLIPLGYLFIHWNAWENICDGFYPLEYRLKCWEIHMWWILSNGIMDW